MSKNIRGNTTANLTVNHISLLNAGFTSFTSGTGILGDLTVTNNLTITGAFNPTNITTGALVSDTLRVIVLPNTTTDTTSRKLIFLGANDEIFTGSIDYTPSTDTLACANITSSGAVTINGSTVLALTEPTNTTTSHTVLLRDESNNRVYKATDFRFSPVEDMLYTPKLNISSLPTIASQDVGYFLCEVGGDIRRIQSGSYDNASSEFVFTNIEVPGTAIINAVANTSNVNNAITFHDTNDKVSFDNVNAFTYNPSSATLKANNIISASSIDTPILKTNGVDISTEFLSMTSTVNQSIASNITLTNVEATSINSVQLKQGFTPISTTFLAKIGSANQTIASSLITMNNLTCDDVTCGDITSDNIITTGLESDALTLNVSAISDPTQVVTLLCCNNNSTSTPNQIERTSNSDITFEPSTGLFKIPKLLIKYFSTTQTNDYLPILQRQSSLVVSIDQPSAGVLDFGYSPGLNTLRVLNIGRDGKSFQMPNNTDTAALGYALTISNATSTPPQTAWSVIPSSSSFVTTDSTAQTITGVKSFNISPVFNNLTGSTSNNEFTILAQNQGTYQMKHFVGDLSYNPFKQQLRCPRYFNQTLQLNYTTTYYCESYTVWDSTNTFGHDTYIKLSHTSSTGGNPTVTQHLQNIQNTATTPTTSAISYGQTASPTYWSLSSSDYEGVWYVSLACIYQNRLSGGSDRVVPRLDIRKYDGTSWVEQPQISVGTQYMRQDQGSLSTLRCQGPVYLNNNNLLRVFCNLEKGSIANPPTFNDSTNSWSGIDITISMRYLGTSTTTESETVTTL